MKWIKEYWDEHSLTLIIGVAILLRLIAAIFSKGFGWHDDHFLVIEAAQSWVDGYDYNNWLPGTEANEGPTGHSFFYVGIHYLIFSFLDLINIKDAQTKMYVIRFLHAAYSLITVVVGYKIAYRLHKRNSAKIVGLLLAAFWFMPFLSVRNLVEVVCIPMLLYGTWLMIKSDDKLKIFKYAFWAGFLFGLAFSTRFQTLVFSCGVGLALLIQKRWKETLTLGIGMIVSIFLTQGITDIFLWGYPFAELFEYINYNIENAYDYNIIAWYSYLLLVLGILIPPISFYFVFGFFRSWKKHLIIFLPALLFFIFHSSFPNKQERFILPAVPFIIILGLVGWNKFVERSKFWNNNKSLLKASWVFFWIINIALLPVFTTMYSKKARVEAMTYISKYDNVNYIVGENSNSTEVRMIPRFYVEAWVKERKISKKLPLEWHKKVHTLDGEEQPDFILFYEDENLSKRVEALKEVLPDITYETTIEPGFIDKIMYKLNPVNANQVIHIYRNKATIPEKINN